MRRILSAALVAFIVPAVEGWAAETPSAVPAKKLVHLTLGLELGEAAYSEDVSIEPTDSDWDAGYIALNADLEIDMDRHGRVRLHGEIFGSGEETEEWKEAGALVQENAMDVSGIEILADWGFPFAPGEKTALTPFAGIGTRGQSFTRDDFVLLGEGGGPAGVGAVDEDFSLFFLHFGVEWLQEISDRFTFAAEAAVSPVIYFEADNSLLGEIEGDGGLITRILARLVYEWRAGREVSLGLHYDLQDLKGDVERVFFPSPGGALVGQLEIPDNELERIGLEAPIRLLL